MDDCKRGLKIAFRLLSMRNMHSGVLERKLISKGFSKSVCEQVIVECKRLSFLNDDDAILREFRRGLGPRCIEYKLRIDRQEVRRLITRSMQKEKIRELSKKQASREKAMRALQRKGFDVDLIIEIFS